MDDECRRDDDCLFVGSEDLAGFDSGSLESKLTRCGCNVEHVVGADCGVIWTTGCAIALMTVGWANGAYEGGDRVGCGA